VGGRDETSETERETERDRSGGDYSSEYGKEKTGVLDVRARKQESRGGWRGTLRYLNSSWNRGISFEHGVSSGWPPEMRLRE
jgi:hypothetical protein